MEITRLFDILELQKNSANDCALAAKVNGEWQKTSYKDYYHQAELVSYGLIKMGIKPGDRIATISNNRPEWNIIDMATLFIGAIHVPIYPNITEEEYTYIISHSGAKIIFISSEIIFQKIKNLPASSPTLEAIFTFERINGTDRLWNEVIELGTNNPQPEILENYKNVVKGTDPATIIYTSGTTGRPKGVVLSHSNILSNVLVARELFPIYENDRILSYLPLCHVYERMVCYLFQYVGCSIYYVENMGTIVDNMQEIKPIAFTTVPRLLEKVYDRILFKGRNLTGIKKKIFFWALETGHKYKETENSSWYNFKLKIADKLVFKKWREAFGGEIRFVVSGGSALQERLARIFWAAKVPVLEGYGLTETSPVIAVNNFKPGNLKFGTVGPPLDNVEVKIAEDGEILSRGPHIMKGYYLDEEMTNSVIDTEGWFHTGDLGKIIDGKFLKITGRKKSMFKTSMGKYIVPEHMENSLSESRFIDQCVIIGEHQKFVGCLIMPNFGYLRNWCNIKEIGYGTNITVVQNPEVRKRFQREIDEFNKNYSPHEQIIKFEIVPDEWTVETGELTPTLKVKRDFIEKKYEHLVKKIYK